MSSDHWWAQFRREGSERERFLAIACALVATGCIAAVYFDPSLLGRHVNLTRGLFFAYFTYSLVNLMITQVHGSCSRGGRLCVHAIGVVGASLITVLTGGAHSPFLILYLFALLAAADLWGMKGTLLTAGACVVLLFLLSITFTSLPDRVQHLNRGGSSFEGIVAVSVSLVMAGYLLGYLAEEDKRRHANALIICRLIGNALPEFGLRSTLEGLMHSVRDYFDADQVRLVLREMLGGEAFLWEVKRPRGSQEEAVHFSKLPDGEREAYFATPPEGVWRSVQWRRPRAHNSLGVVSSPERDGGSPSVSSSAFGRFLVPNVFPDELYDMRVVGERHALFGGFGSLLAVSFSCRREWFGRLLVYNSNRRAYHKGDARFLEALVREVGPAIYNMYHLRRLRSRARAMERSRIAHELHDGVIQSLIGMEMETDAARRQASSDPSRLLKEMNRLGELLRKEIVDLRERMQLLKKPFEVEPAQLVKHLAGTVDEFRREQSVSARFVSDCQEVSLSPRVCSELVRILQEALVNIRKHSGARNVLVRFGRQDEKWKLLIEDDGCGFGFTGRLSLAELEASSMAPRVIKERIRSIGGELVIESVPGCGARLEISLPPRPYEQAA
ncbi:MAG: histidine kinase [Terriglobia bacterium]